ncbi:Stf0 family sulfotransferase [Alteraurantiacibacter buctensis]|uniref:Sulphotransferase Stf0 domain-containing protein n=1 Tax=Alteraurantiacibacter buctensis TaxID=1503981 RepID=A0A844YW23_9SPHN|nr:Stf0 family sulfotransferase [Alteraurantiacibacter buctensis]MXO71256.1 hypothetical protein [Alteraurantiacibacter buctensis]
MAAEARKHYDLTSRERDYAAWRGPPRRSLVICTLPRSGSTLLGEAMYFAGGLGCPLEYLHAGFRPRFEEIWDVTGLEGLVEALWRNRTDPSGVLSVKLMWRDVVDVACELAPGRFGHLGQADPQTLSPESYRDLLALIGQLLPNPAFIHLYRRDRVRQAVSGVVAEQTGQWRSIPGAEMQRRADPVYDAEAISRQIAYADWSNAHWRNLLAHAGSSRALAYEDLVRDFSGTLVPLLRELGSSGEPPPPRMQRQADGHSEQFVLRYLMEQAKPA